MQNAVPMTIQNAKNNGLLDDETIKTFCGFFKPAANTITQCTTETFSLWFVQTRWAFCESIMETLHEALHNENGANSIEDEQSLFDEMFFKESLVSLFDELSTVETVFPNLPFCIKLMDAFLDEKEQECLFQSWDEIDPLFVPAVYHCFETFLNKGNASYAKYLALPPLPLFAETLLHSFSQAFKESFALNRPIFKQAYACFLQFLDECIAQKLQKGIVQPNKKETLYQLKKLSFAQHCMFEETIFEFLQILNFGKANHNEMTKHNDIVVGILETIGIKIESLQEEKDIFCQETKEAFKRFAKETVAISPKDEKEAKNRVLEALLPVLLLEQDHNEVCIKAQNALAQVHFDDLFETYAQISRRIDLQNEQWLQKKMLRCKRETLLYEMSTFEEILNHSVSVLRQSDDDWLIAFVKTIDHAMIQLEAMLIKFGIQTIKPSPHDMFNGKEQEILTAEENPLFKKGEIIKRLNSGYKEGDVVIMRANVIAAK